VKPQALDKCLETITIEGVSGCEHISFALGLWSEVIDPNHSALHQIFFIEELYNLHAKSIVG